MKNIQEGVQNDAAQKDVPISYSDPPRHITAHMPNVGKWPRICYKSFRIPSTLLFFPCETVCRHHECAPYSYSQCFTTSHSLLAVLNHAQQQV